MSRPVLATLLGALTLMVTGFIFWGVLSDSMGIVAQATNEDDLRRVLSEAAPADGTVFVPMEGFGTEEFTRRHAEGPVAMIYLRPAGTPAAMGATMMKGFLHFLISAAFAVWIWRSFAREQETFGRRFLFLFALGLFTAIVAHPANRIWWHYPMSFTLFALVANTVSWAAAAAVMAATLRPHGASR